MAKDLELALRITAKDSTGPGIGKARAGVDSISRQLQIARNAFLSFQGAMGLQAGVSGLVKLADEIQSVNARLKLAVSSSQEFAAAQQMAYRVAAQTGAGYEAVATLYARLSTTAKDYGLSQERIARVTEATALALRVSGASAAESAGAVRQFSQAIGSGVLRGDEFNSMMEQAPRLMKALADGLGLPIGKLRGLAEQGLLTTELVVSAIESQSQALKREAAAMPGTVGQALSAVRDELGRTVDKFNQSVGATKAVGQAFQAMARNMDAIAGTGAVAVMAGLTAALVRVTTAGYEHLRNLAARIAADRQAIATSIAHMRARLSYAEAELAAAQAAVASASGMARLTVVENTLIPAQQRLAAAQAGLNAAMATGGIIARGLSTALAFVGGPLGLILSLLAAGATAWAIWGDKAQDAGNKAREAINRARDAAARLAREEKFGTGDSADLREGITLLEQRKAVLDETLRVSYRGNPSKKFKAELAKVEADLAEFRRGLAKAETRGESGVPGSPTAAGRALLRKQWDAYVAQYNEGADKLKAAIAELKAKAKESGISEDSAEFKAALAKLNAKLGEKPKKESLNLPEFQRDSQAYYLEQQALLENDRAANERAFQSKLISAEAYYTKLRELAEAEATLDLGRLAQQKTALTAQIEQLEALNLKTKEDRLARDNAVAEARIQLGDTDAQITARQIRLAGQLNAVRDAEQDKRTEALISAQSLIDAIEQEAVNLGLTNDERARAVALLDLEKLKASLTAEEYNKLAEAMSRALDTRQAAEARKKALDEAKQQAKDIYKALTENLQRSIADVLNNGFNGDGARGAVLTFVDFLRTSLSNVISAQLTQQILNLFPKDSLLSVGGFLGLGGKRDGSNPANAVYVQDVAAGVLPGATAAGGEGSLFGGFFETIKGWFGQLGGMLSSLFSSLMSSLSGLFSGGGELVSAIGSLFGFAAGGYTGAGGKYQPAGVVHRGEFVFSQAAVNNLGLPALDLLHRLASGIAAPRMPRLSYADGGLVNLPAGGAAQPTVNTSTRVVNLFDPSQVAGELGKTREFELAVLNVIQLNPHAVQGGV